MLCAKQAAEGLDGVEIKLLFFDKFLEREVKTDGTLIDDVWLRRGAEELLQAGLKGGNFLRRDGLGGANEFRRIPRVDVNAEHAHPLRGIGNAAGLTHA